MTTPWTPTLDKVGDQLEVSTSRLFKGTSSDRFGVLYRQGQQDVVWQAINFDGDKQVTTSNTALFTSSPTSGRKSSQLNMDCLGKVSDTRPKGQCAITWTFQDNNADTNKKIKIHFMDEDGGEHTQLQIGEASANDSNSMVVLTDENNYVVTFMSNSPPT